MPGLDGTGPEGKGPIIGRRFGRSRMASVPALEPAIAAQPDHNEEGSAVPQGPIQNTPVYGRGRGGIPCGCGQGFGFRGGRRLRG